MRRNLAKGNPSSEKAGGFYYMTPLGHGIQKIRMRIQNEENGRPVARAPPFLHSEFGFLSFEIPWAGSLRQRQPNRKCRSLPFFARHPNRPMVRLDDRLRDVKAQAEAAVVAAGDVAGAVEALEQLRD